MTKQIDVNLPNLSGGVVLDSGEWEIQDNQLVDVLNMYYDGKSLRLRDGQQHLIQSTSNIPILAIYNWDSTLIYHIGTKLYKYINNTSTEIYTNITSNEGKFFEFNNYLYYLNSTNYYKIDNSFNVTIVEGYIPLVNVNTTPSLSQTDTYEAINFLTGKFKINYNGDGTTKTYKIPTSLLPLTNTFAPTSNIGTIQSVDYTNGTITFSTAPEAGTNNVTITAKSTTDGRSNITNCKYIESYGGLVDGLAGGTRVFMAGNTTYPAQYYQSSIRNPEYFPDNVGDTVGNTSISITGFLKSFGQLLIIKSDSIHTLEYTVNENNKPQFVHREITSNVGCDIPKSLQLINNIPIFCNTQQGVFIITGNNLYSENNVLPISLNINKSLLSETNLQNAVCIDYNGKYILAVNGNCYIYDYTYSPYNTGLDIYTAQRKTAWYLWNNKFETS